MTAAPQPLGRLTTVLEHILRALAWTTQAGAATAYLAICLRPSAWEQARDTNSVSVLCMVVFAVAATCIWALSLWLEQHRFYDRFTQRACRKVGLISHGVALAVASTAVVESQDRIVIWIGLPFLGSAAAAVWAAWMQTRLLSDEDQAVIDEIISREATQRAASYNASERERRRVRLTSIAEGLGYALTDGPRPSPPANAPAVTWTIPAGKHAPLVYFIANGNRMKIGTTTELKRRIRTLALRPDNVVLLVDGDRRRERAYHQQFAHLRVGRTEWFAYEGALADYVHAQTGHLTQKGQGQ